MAKSVEYRYRKLPLIGLDVAGKAVDAEGEGSLSLDIFDIWKMLQQIFCS